jgi:prolyl oligopeptidase
VLLDPNKLSEDGTVALSGLSISEDGNLMAYGLSTAGSDWQEWKVRDVEKLRGFRRSFAVDQVLRRILE